MVFERGLGRSENNFLFLDSGRRGYVLEIKVKKGRKKNCHRLKNSQNTFSWILLFIGFDQVDIFVVVVVAEFLFLLRLFDSNMRVYGQ